MSKDNSSNSETEEKGADSSSEETETGENGEKTQSFSDYENLRLKRMAENKARMEAMGLHKMAASLMGSPQKKEKNNKKEKKGKRKVDEEDEDYKPEEEEETMGFLSDDDDDNNESGDSSMANSKKAKKKSSTSSKKVTSKNVASSSDFVDDDDDLMQAIALSLQGSAGFLDIVDRGPSSSPRTHVKDCDVDKRREISPIKEDTGRRKKKKSTSNRVQMTEDELILHFFQFDGTGRGGITLQDIRRVAAGHDFTWSDKEMADMVHIFDTDGDGKLSLEDFRKIVGRCKMIQPMMD